MNFHASSMKVPSNHIAGLVLTNTHHTVDTGRWVRAGWARWNLRQAETKKACTLAKEGHGVEW